MQMVDYLIFLDQVEKEDGYFNVRSFLDKLWNSLVPLDDIRLILMYF